MIRFCDKEVCCVRKEDLDRQQLMSYFLSGNRNELVCILDEESKYVGKITYDSLLGRDIEDAINRDYLVLDENIWKNGRNYFYNCQKYFGGVDLVPVLDKEHCLYCFAWQDDEANRELRMLDELMACSNSLDFKHLYPEYGCVIVDGCNELAYFFVKYLRKIGVSVYVAGEMWKAIGVENVSGLEPEEEALDYKRYTVYSEGAEAKTKSVALRSSVSAEFECIDQIYEENIRKGIIKDTAGNFQNMLEYICGKQIAIIGIGAGSLNAYDLFIENGIDICCFISEKDEHQKKILFGKPILKRAEAVRLAKDIIFVEPDSKYSAWGFGGVDDYHYLGFERNERYFLLQDYIEIPKRGLINVLNSMMTLPERKLVLIGDVWLCMRLCKILEMQNGNMHGRMVYCDILKEYEKEKEKIVWIDVNEICETDVCILLLPKRYGCAYKKDGHIAFYDETMKEEYLKKVDEYLTQVYVADYSFENFMLTGNDIRMENNADSDQKVKKIIIGSIRSYSGNVFFRSLLDHHPEIIMLQYNYINDNLYYICNRLAAEKASNILSLFWKLCKEGQTFSGADEWNANDKEKFAQSMKEMLSEKDVFTSQELFVMIHISYAKMCGRKIEDISKWVIYWEPHFVSRTILEEYSTWLGEICDSGYIVNVVRNAYIRAGSGLKDIEKMQKRFSGSGKDVFRELLPDSVVKKRYGKWKRLVFKFEDLKLRPQEELERFCRDMGIAWSQTLLETTINGEKSYYGKVKGFDLTPVYNTYEEYFSAFDRFRISLISAIWQKKYGYPYVSSLEFSRMELREILAKKFRFEEKLRFSNYEEEQEFQRWKRKIMSDCLWMTRRMEICETFANSKSE